MIDLEQRWQQKELLDRDDIPFEDIKKNMQELNTVNTLLGGHSITINGFKQLLPAAAKAIHVCEAGCGGGDNLFAIDRYCSSRKIDARFTGIDLKPECIAFAKERSKLTNTHWITSDYKLVIFPDGKPDIIFSSLFCHHFTDAQLVEMMQWMRHNSRLGFFINDLQRHPVAYYAIKWITSLCSSSYLVKNDAPLSVARSFKKRDWQMILQAAGITNYTIQWKWAFRYLLVCPQA